jgi:2-polyprenyl-6-methoxyphenol hydroxylase-like FAD-dependent oxidoreductase
MFLFVSQPLDYDRRDSAQQKKLLADAYAGAGWEVPHLIGAAENAQGSYFDSLSLVELDHWAKGRVVLTGDAAFCASPASGQGTSLALVGAYVYWRPMTMRPQSPATRRSCAASPRPTRTWARTTSAAW